MYCGTFFSCIELLRLCKTQNALQLLVFFLFFVFLFFCQSYPGLQNSKSVFLILKIPRYGGFIETVISACSKVSM